LSIKKCIPGIYPKEAIPEYSPESERKVYNAIKEALPSNWYAWHSIKFKSRKENDIEIDFVIADPNRGILVAEVKGGLLRKQNGKWYQYQNNIQDPSKQASKCKYALIDRYREKNIIAPPIENIFFFPDTDASEQPTQGNMQGLVIGIKELPHLKKIINDLMVNALPKNLRKKASKGWVKFIHDLWCERWIPETKLYCRTKKGIENRLKLDKYQFNSLCGALENDKVLVKGGAGTGKTVLACELARKEAALNRNVLMLCFTDALGINLSKAFKEQNITAAPIGKFAVNLLRNTGHKITESYTHEFWDTIPLQAAVDGLPPEDKRWDTVIVDEGQDMGDNEWELIRECAMGKKRIWIFMDESQAFWKERNIPDDFLDKCFKYDLGRPYRCPPDIQALVDAYSGKESETVLIHSTIKDGTIKITKSIPSKVHENVGKEINELLKEGFEPSDIAVISLRGMMFKENIMHLKTLGGNEIVKATDENIKEYIICDTFLRCKGLERPAIIVTDLRFVSDNYNTRMSIAVSRAMGVLRIIGAKDEIEKDFVLSKLLF